MWLRFAWLISLGIMCVARNQSVDENNQTESPMLNINLKEPYDLVVQYEDNITNKKVTLAAFKALDFDPTAPIWFSFGYPSLFKTATGRIFHVQEFRQPFVFYVKILDNEQKQQLVDYANVVYRGSIANISMASIRPLYEANVTLQFGCRVYVEDEPNFYGFRGSVENFDGEKIRVEMHEDDDYNFPDEHEADVQWFESNKSKLVKCRSAAVQRRNMTKVLTFTPAVIEKYITNQLFAYTNDSYAIVTQLQLTRAIWHVRNDETLIGDLQQRFNSRLFKKRFVEKILEELDLASFQLFDFNEVFEQVSQYPKPCIWTHAETVDQLSGMYGVFKNKRNISYIGRIRGGEQFPDGCLQGFDFDQWIQNRSDEFPEDIVDSIDVQLARINAFEQGSFEYAFNGSHFIATKLRAVNISRSMLNTTLVFPEFTYQFKRPDYEVNYTFVIPRPPGPHDAFSVDLNAFLSLVTDFKMDDGTVATLRAFRVMIDGQYSRNRPIWASFGYPSLVNLDEAELNFTRQGFNLFFEFLDAAQKDALAEAAAKVIPQGGTAVEAIIPLHWAATVLFYCQMQVTDGKNTSVIIGSAYHFDESSLIANFSLAHQDAEGVQNQIMSGSQLVECTLEVQSKTTPGTFLNITVEMLQDALNRTVGSSEWDSFLLSPLEFWQFLKNVEGVLEERGELKHLVDEFEINNVRDILFDQKTYRAFKTHPYTYSYEKLLRSRSEMNATLHRIFRIEKTKAGREYIAMVDKRRSNWTAGPFALDAQVALVEKSAWRTDNTTIGDQLAMLNELCVETGIVWGQEAGRIYPHDIYAMEIDFFFQTMEMPWIKRKLIDPPYSESYKFVIGTNRTSTVNGRQSSTRPASTPKGTPNTKTPASPVQSSKTAAKSTGVAVTTTGNKSGDSSTPSKIDPRGNTEKGPSTASGTSRAVMPPGGIVYLTIGIVMARRGRGK